MINLTIILKIVLFIGILVLSYFVVNLLRPYFDPQYKEIKDMDRKNPESRSWFVKKNSFKILNSQYIEDKLLKCGNPLHLTPVSYWLLKIVLGIVLLLSTFQIAMGRFSNYGSKPNMLDCLVVSIPFAIFGFFLVDFLNRLSNRDDLDKIRMDLADVYDLINLQTMAGVNIGQALVEAYTVCRNKRFQKSLIKLAAKINLSKNIEKALNEFNDEYNFIEIDNFVSTIKQCISSGTYEEALDDQSTSLQAENSMYIEKQSDKIDRYMLLIDILMFVGILGIVFFVVMGNLFHTGNNIFK